MIFSAIQWFKHSNNNNIFKFIISCRQYLVIWTYWSKIDNIFDEIKDFIIIKISRSENALHTAICNKMLGDMHTNNLSAAFTNIFSKIFQLYVSGIWIFLVYAWYFVHLLHFLLMLFNYWIIYCSLYFAYFRNMPKYS